MDELRLVRPSKNMEEAIWQYRREFFDNGETHINGSCALAKYDDFDEWLDVALSIERDRLSRDGIHASTFFSVRESDGRVIGSLQLRHALTAELERHAGHIGYGVRPSERRKGYGRRQLLLGLEAAREIGLKRVMISCDGDNIASSRTILSCGGVLAREDVYEGKEQLVYWIDLAARV